MAAGLILFEDEHLLVAHKPSGINTHKPDRYAPDGLHEWLTRQGRSLSILHRLDKDTSGVIVFGKTTRANQSLTRQFTEHTVRKNYLLLAGKRPSRAKFRAKFADAVTEFEFLQPHGDAFLVRAQPITGKTHQIRRHAKDNGFPVLGDTEYGGAPAPRLMLHAHTIEFEHPGSGDRVRFEASVPAVFDDLDALTAAREFRELLFDEDTNAYRLISGAADGFPDVIVDWYDGRLLVQWQTEAAQRSGEALCARLQQALKPASIHEQLVTRARRAAPRALQQNCYNYNKNVVGGAEARFSVAENGLGFWVNFGEGLSTGLFLDQRENRRQLRTMDLAGKTVLNCFAYTCAFSVAAAKAGAKTTSVDLSKNYLEWGRENFRANDLDPSRHDFVAGDVFEWLKRFAKRGQTWDVVLLDPPTFSTTKSGRRFQAERDYGALVEAALPSVARGGLLFCSTNQRTLTPEKFEAIIRGAGRTIAELEYRTLPFDFRVPAGERPYLKTMWARVEA